MRLTNRLYVESVDTAYTGSEADVDGGYGWFVCVGAFCALFISVMQDNFHKTMFADNPNALLQLSFVGTLTLFCLHALSPVVRIAISKFGVRPAIILGTVLISLSMELAVLATQIWHLYLTQGVLFGIALSIAPQWFTKRRGLALGIIASGSGMGGLVFPLIVTPLNRNMGPAWTYRILGCICLLMNTIACIFIKERVRYSTDKKKILNIQVLNNNNFLLFCIAADLIMFGYFVPLFLLPENATYLGLSDTQGSSCVIVCCAMSFIGRIITGAVADLVGKLNSLIIFSLMTAIACLLIWPFAFTFPALMIFSVVFGIGSGTYFALMSPVTAEILGMEKLQTGLSVLIFANALSTFGPTVATAIDASVHASPFLSFKIFTGVCYLAGVLLLIILKLRINRNLMAKV
ncbi:major facilitator superfamily domain-containing protein [Mucor lusitanicus]